MAKEYYTVCLTPTEHKAISEFIEAHHVGHIKDLRKRDEFANTYKRLENAVNKIINSKPVQV